MRNRLVLLAALSAGAVLAPLAGAAPAPQIVDPKGDALGAQAAYDIVSVTYETTKASKAKNAPLKDFVVTMELAGPATIAPGTSYTVRADDTPCGGLIMYAYWGLLENGPTVGGFFNTCGPLDDTTGVDAAYLEPRTKAEGNKLSFTVAAASVPKAARTATFGGLKAVTAPAEPLAGISTDLIFSDLGAPEGTGAFDLARSDKTYKFGS